MRYVSWQEDGCPRLGLDRLAVNGKCHLVLHNVESFFFPMVDVRWRNIALSGDQLDQGELHERVFTCRQERHLMTTVPDRVFEGVPSPAKCGGR